MKRQLIAAVLLGAATTLTYAQASPEVPKAKCEPKPVLPGQRMMEEASVRKRFQSDLDAYKKCMNAYLDDRKAAIKANEVAANAAIEEYNGTMKALADAQKAQ
jgi:Skp family chaperone for outer membrane proteins